MSNRKPPAPSPASPSARAAGAASEVPDTFIPVADLHLLADPSGALLIADARVLVVADLHLEKGSAFGLRRQFLPPYDTAATLARLAAVVARHAPRLVVALGDSFHDRRAAARLQPADLDALRALQAGRSWLWLAGNHDPDPPPGVEGDVATEWSFGPLRFRHEPQPGPQPGEIAGHLHPVAVVAGRGGARARRRAFVGDGTRCVMPAFGAYAGGLNLHHAAFAALFAPGTRTAHALGRDRVYSISERRCLAER